MTVKGLISKLEDIDIEPVIFMAVEERLMMWLKISKEKYSYNSIPKETRITLESQVKLGWKPFIYYLSQLPLYRHCLINPFFHFGDRNVGFDVSTHRHCIRSENIFIRWQM